MNRLKCLILAAVAVTCLMVTVPKIKAQVNIDIGTAPDCPYGYYDYAPYACAPYGYYGPEWFTGGDVFVGAGPWFHGDDGFRGHVDNHFDRQHGYKGPAPKVGDRREASRQRLDKMPSFKGNEVRDGRGHTGENKKY